MNIKYDELELLELFYSEAESLTGTIEDGELLYRRTIENFKLTMFIYTYELKINIFLQFKGKDVLSIELHNISELKKTDSYLKIFQNNKEAGKILFGETFVVDIEV